MGPWLAVIVSKCPRLKNVYKSNGRYIKSPTTKGTIEGNNRRSSVYTLLKTYCAWVCVCVNAYAIGCGVLAKIEQWYPTRKFNGTMVPHKRNSIVWPHLTGNPQELRRQLFPRKLSWF